MHLLSETLCPCGCPLSQVSAKTAEEDIVEGLKCGADDYVTKPFKRSELAARIRAHIRARDAFVEQQVCVLVIYFA